MSAHNYLNLFSYTMRIIHSRVNTQGILLDNARQCKTDSFFFLFHSFRISFILIYENKFIMDMKSNHENNTLYLVLTEVRKASLIPYVLWRSTIAYSPILILLATNSLFQ